jgi:KaiC/GvpD/RAD55 family RecA-like ATPase
MERIPFGISRLDTTLGGGAPRGSVVLLTGEAGAGGREFMYTAAVMNGTAYTDQELFDLHYGQRAENTVLPEEIHYLSFTDTYEQFEQDVELSMETDLARAGLERVNFNSLAESYFRTSPVPRDWYITEGGSTRSTYPGEQQNLVNLTGDILNECAPGNLVVIDSLSDLVSATGEQLEWPDIIYFVKGLRRVAHEWNGLILLHVDHETLTSTEHGQLIDSCSGSLRFKWSTGGSVLARTLMLKSFRGILSQIDEDDLVEFESELGDSGFTVSDIRKIR